MPRSCPAPHGDRTGSLIVAAAVALCLAVAMLALPAADATASPGTQLASASYGYPYANPPDCDEGATLTGCVVDNRGFYQGQCTSWVAYRLSQLNGVSFTNSYLGQHWGDASHWGEAARNAHISVDTVPKLGAVVWYASGHVGYVEAVNPDGSVLMSEMNRDYHNGFRFDTISPGYRWPTGFIHIKDRPDPASTPGPSWIVQWDGDRNPQTTAWRIGKDGQRRWIASARAFNCLKRGGVPGPAKLSDTTLTHQFPDLRGRRAPCGGDLNDDGVVSLLDLNILAREYRTAGSWADINLDGTVNYLDLSILASQWNREPYGSTAGTARVSAPAADAGYRRVGPQGAAGDGPSATPAVSDDGRLVAFVSSASNLVAGDQNGVDDVFVLDRSTGGIRRISMAADGAEATASSSDVHISPNGRYVAFDTTGSLTVDDTNTGRDVYRYDRTTGQLVLFSALPGHPDGPAGDGVYAAAALSSGAILLQSAASNIVAGDSNGVADVFIRDLPTGPVRLVSAGNQNALGNQESYGGTASENGRYIAFVSRADNLVAGDTNAAADIFVRDTVAGSTTRVTSAAGAQLGADSNDPSISADGTALVYESAAADVTGAVPADTHQVYLADARSGRTTSLVSANASKQPGNKDSTQPRLSSNGVRVAFRSQATNFTPRDTNKADDIFLASLDRKAVGRVSVPASLAQGNAASAGPALNRAGTVVAFATDADNIRGADRNYSTDIIAKATPLLLLTASPVRIAGRPRVGHKLTAKASTWGPGRVKLTYKWRIGRKVVRHAHGKHLRLTAAMKGKKVIVTVTGRQVGYSTHAVTSPRTSKIKRRR